MLTATFAWGDVSAVLEHGTRSAALEGPDSPWYPVLTWALGWAHYCNDELDLAEQRLRETVALGPRAEQWIVAVASIADLSLIAGMRGKRAEQARLADEAVDLARERGLLDSVEVGEVHTARGVALAAAGHPEAALPELEQGVLLRRLWAQQLDLVDGLIALAPVAAAIGDRARARRALRRGGGDPGRAVPTRARCRAGSRRPGARPARRRRRDGCRAERSRARRAPAPRRRQLGARDRPELFLSFNTVHSHVKSIYRKLGVSSRAEALAQARARRLI